MLVLISCGQSGPDNEISEVSKTPSSLPSVSTSSDTLRILASQLFASRTYEDYLEGLFDPGHIVWVDASELENLALMDLWDEVDGVLLTGGEDIHPDRYNMPDEISLCGEIDLERDELEAHLLRMVDSLRLPCLGICRGLQFMNVHGGGTLYPHLPLALGNNLHRAGEEGASMDTVHWVRASAAGHFLGMEDGAVSDVVSHHHQGINELAPNLIPWAHAPDGLIEGIRHNDTLRYPCYIGVQWHPERSAKNQSLVESVGSFFLNHAATRSNN